jgi:uncharacterized protein
VCERCLLAETALTRMRGLLGRRDLPSGEGILLKPAGSVHMAFMRFAIDAVFLDREMRVVKIAAALRPWRAARARGAKSCLEIAAGEAARRGLTVGDRLTVDSSPATAATLS